MIYFKVTEPAGNEHHLVAEFVAVASYLFLDDTPYLYLPDGMLDDYPLGSFLFVLLLLLLAKLFSLWLLQRLHHRGISWPEALKA